MKKSLIGYLLLFSFLIGLVASQVWIEKKTLRKTEMMYFVPKPEHLPYTTFGFKPVIADLLWFRGVSYFIQHLTMGTDYPYLYGIFHASVTLDPQFKQVYRDTMTLLINDKDHYTEAEKLLSIGRTAMPKDWEIHYLSGLLYRFYLKDDEKSLQNLEKAWDLIPREERYASPLDTINILIRSFTEKTADQRGLVLYWREKYFSAHSRDAKVYSHEQILKYSSAWMEEALNQIHLKEGSETEKQEEMLYQKAQWDAFFTKYEMSQFMEAPFADLFVKVDAYGYPWVFSQKMNRIYSYGNAFVYLKRKLAVFNVILWSKAQKYLEYPVSTIVLYPNAERERYVQLKPEYQEFPLLEEIMQDVRKELACESPLLPVYVREKCVFRVPSYNELSQIDLNFR